MKYIQGIDRSQIILFPNKVDDLVTEDNPVRFIDAFVNQLDLINLGFKNAKLHGSCPGASTFSPRCLLKLYVFGYYKKTRSSRKLMELCKTNIEVMWLIGRLAPDFRTIANFRKDNASALKNVLKAFVSMCVELGLYSLEVGYQDGSKFRAVNSKDNNVTENKLNKKMQLAEEKIAKYLEELDKIDKEDCDTPEHTVEEMNEKIKQLKERKEECSNLLETMKAEGERQLSFNDPEARLMKTSNGGFDVCYNTQILVDSESHLVGAVEVTNKCNDLGQLSNVAVNFKNEHCNGIFEVGADNGYEDTKDMLESLANGVIPNVTPKDGKKFFEIEIEQNEKIITDEMLNSVEPEDLRSCLESGVLPKAYEGKGIEVEIEEVEEVIDDNDEDAGSFNLNDEGTGVICPNGSTLKRVARLRGKNKTRYVNKSACKKCKSKCTKSIFRQIDLRDGQKVLRMRRKRKVKKVIIRITPDKEIINKRKQVVEHPFGTVKRWMDGSYTLLKGVEKVGADLSMLFLAYNIKRVLNMVGISELMSKMKECGEQNTNLFLGFLHFLLNSLKNVACEEFFLSDSWTVSPAN